MVRSDGEGALVLGAGGTRRLRDDQVTGRDPLHDFGPNAADHLRRTDGFAHCPDLLVNCLYDAEANEVAPFEEFMVRSVGPEVVQRIPSGHLIVAEAPRSARTQHQGALTVGADHDEADAGMVDERSDQTRVQAVDLLDREPVVAFGQGDQPEAARCEDYGGVLRGVPTRLLGGLALLSDHHVAVHDLTARRTSEHPAGGRVLVTGVGQRTAD